MAFFAPNYPAMPTMRGGLVIDLCRASGNGWCNGRACVAPNAPPPASSHLALAPFRPANGAHLAGVAAAAEELIGAVGFEARYGGAGRHLDLLQHFSGLRIDAPQIALVAFPGAVALLAIDAGDAGDDAVGLDGAQHLAGLRVDLVNLPLPMVAHPERTFGPGEAGIAAAARRGD